MKHSKEMNESGIQEEGTISKAAVIKICRLRNLFKRYSVTSPGELYSSPLDESAVDLSGLATPKQRGLTLRGPRLSTVIERGDVRNSSEWTFSHDVASCNIIYIYIYIAYIQHI